MPRLTVATPRINANEDQVRMVEILVKAGDAVKKRQHLLTIESTKASSEVYAEQEGVVEKIHGDIGEMVDVGAPLYALTVEGAVAEEAHAAQATAEGGGIAITAKARQRARELGVDIAAVPPQAGRIGVQEVEAYAAKHPIARAPSGRKAVILGGGGHAVTVLDALQGQGYDLVGAVDPKLPIGHHVYAGVTVIGRDDDLEKLYQQGVRSLFLGVGGATDSRLRAKLYDKALAMGFELPPIISPAAYVAANARVGQGTVVLAGAVLGPNVVVGANSIINHHATVCHDSVVGDHCHLTPGAVLAGTCRVGEHSVVGMCATVLFGVSVGAGCLVHNNASVISDLPDGMQYTREGKISENG